MITICCPFITLINIDCAKKINAVLSILHLGDWMGVVMIVYPPRPHSFIQA